MSKAKPTICPSCGHRHPTAVPNNRCVSCGANMDEGLGGPERASRPSIDPSRYVQDGFNMTWFGIAAAITAVLTAAIVMGLPMVISLFDFEGSAGMMVAIPVWFVSGLLVGLISPGKTFIEPVVATLLVAIPTVFLLIRSETVKAMPLFMYVLMAALGVLFSLVGSYAGERIQAGNPDARVRS